MSGKSLSSLPAFDGTDLNVINETPKGSGIKNKYDEKTGTFKVSKIMPAGMAFSFNFGFIPSTLAADGDPLDVLLLMEDVAGLGVLVPSRLLGMIEAEQTEGGKTNRNDRLIAVPTASRIYGDVKSLSDLKDALLIELEFFFVTYNRFLGREFKPLRRAGPQAAIMAVEHASHRYQASSQSHK